MVSDIEKITVLEIVELAMATKVIEVYNILNKIIKRIKDDEKEGF